MGFFPRIKQTCIQLYHGLKNKELLLTILFFVILYGVFPALDGFLYYYLSDVAGISDAQLSILNIIKYPVLFMGALAYAVFFKTKEPRLIVGIGCLVNLTVAALKAMLTKDITLGLSPYGFLCVVTCISMLHDPFILVPFHSLLAKLIPH